MQTVLIRSLSFLFLSDRAHFHPFAFLPFTQTVSSIIISHIMAMFFVFALRFVLEDTSLFSTTENRLGILHVLTKTLNSITFHDPAQYIIQDENFLSSMTFCLNRIASFL